MRIGHPQAALPLHGRRAGAAQLGVECERTLRVLAGAIQAQRHLGQHHPAQRETAPRARPGPFSWLLTTDTERKPNTRCCRSGDAGTLLPEAIAPDPRWLPNTCANSATKEVPVESLAWGWYKDLEGRSRPYLADGHSQSWHTLSTLPLPERPEALTADCLTAALRETGTIRTATVESFELEDLGGIPGLIGTLVILLC